MTAPPFQFQSGTIKGVGAEAFLVFAGRFQFQSGTIKGGTRPQDLGIRFDISIPIWYD